MSSEARDRYLRTHIATIANEVRHGLQAIPNCWDGIQAITAALDRFEHNALLWPREIQTEVAFDNLKDLCRRFRANVYPEMLEAGFRAIQNTPIAEEDARERDRLRQQYVETQRAMYNQLAAQQATDMYNRNNYAQMLGAQDSGAAYRQAMQAMQAYNYYGSPPRNDEAEKRGMDLLRDNLSENQRNELEQNGWFHVVGNSSGKTFRLFKARQMNIMELDKNGGPKWCWCFLPSGGVVLGDVLLAQKLALESDEKAALRLANRFAPNMCQGSNSWVPSDGAWRDLYNSMHATESNRERINRLYGNQGVTVDYGTNVNEESRSWLRRIAGF